MSETARKNSDFATLTLKSPDLKKILQAQLKTVAAADKLLDTFRRVVIRFGGNLPTTFWATDRYVVTAVTLDADPLGGDLAAFTVHHDVIKGIIALLQPNKAASFFVTTDGDVLLDLGLGEPMNLGKLGTDNYPQLRQIVGDVAPFEAEHAGSLLALGVGPAMVVLGAAKTLGLGGLAFGGARSGKATHFEAMTREKNAIPGRFHGTIMALRLGDFHGSSAPDLTLSA